MPYRIAHGRPALSSLFCLYRDSPERRTALARPPAAPERYRLLRPRPIRRSRGVGVRHNLERDRPPRWARASGDRASTASSYGAGGYGGDFASVLASLRAVNAADVVLSTVDTVGIPLILLRRAGSSGRRSSTRRSACRSVSCSFEAGDAAPVCRRAPARPRDRRLRRERGGVAPRWLGHGRRRRSSSSLSGSTPTRSARSRACARASTSSRSAPIPAATSSCCAASPRGTPSGASGSSRPPSGARSLGPLPANVALETDISLEQVRDRLARRPRRRAAGPRQQLLGRDDRPAAGDGHGQAGRRLAHRRRSPGYGLEDGINCRLVEPGDARQLERAIMALLADDAAAAALGARARETVERGLTRDAYAAALWRVLAGAARSEPRRAPSERASATRKHRGHPSRRR